MIYAVRRQGNKCKREGKEEKEKRKSKKKKG